MSLVIVSSQPSQLHANSTVFSFWIAVFKAGRFFFKISPSPPPPPALPPQGNGLNSGKMWAKRSLLAQQLFASNYFLMQDMQWRACVRRQEGAKQSL